MRSFEDAYRIEGVKEVKHAVEQTGYYLTWMRAEKALRLSLVSPSQKDMKAEQ